jgi:hypothetical protein
MSIAASLIIISLTLKEKKKEEDNYYLLRLLYYLKERRKVSSTFILSLGALLILEFLSLYLLFKEINIDYLLIAS